MCLLICQIQWYKNTYITTPLVLYLVISTCALTVFECWVYDGAKECRHNNDGVKPVRNIVDWIWFHVSAHRWCYVIKFSEPLKTQKCSSPVPEMMAGEERPWLGRVQFENDLQHIKSQKTPLSIWYHRVLLIQTNEHSIHQDNQVIDINKHSETHNTNIWNSNSVVVQKKKKHVNVLVSMQDQYFGLDLLNRASVMK